MFDKGCSNMRVIDILIIMKMNLLKNSLKNGVDTSTIEKMIQ